MEKTTDSYNEAHLFIAAVRVHWHRQKKPPSIEEICEFLGMSSEWGNALSRKLQQLGVISVAETRFSTKVFIEDHTRLENIPPDREESGLQREIADFKQNRQNLSVKVEAIQADLAKKKQDLFSEIEKQLKKRPPGPEDKL